MPHTPLLNRIVEVARLAGGTAKPAFTRRSLLKGAVAAAVTTVGASGAAPPRIVIVGAGLAGLTCAYRLTQKGIAADVYDASNRAGGRCYSLRGAFDEGQIVERGGELIDQSHTDIRQLCQELRLPLDNLLAAEPNGSEPFYYPDGQMYPVRDAVADLKSIWNKLHSDLSAASYPTTYYQSTARGRELDQMSIIDWLNESIPGGGANSRLGKLLDLAYNIEYGEECSRQSALNLVYLLGYSGPGQLRVFGPSNEKYHVRGGNDQIATVLAARLGGAIRYGKRLSGFQRRTDGTYALTFNGTEVVTADRVVMAIPFSVLRRLNLTASGFRPLKRTAIAQLGMGANAKLHLQFTNRYWYSSGCNGETYGPGYQNTWEVTRAQPGVSGILVNYTGGDRARDAANIKPLDALGSIAKTLPGLTPQWNGKSQLENWPLNPLTNGSYSYWKKGQYTLFAGVEGEVEGNCHFCGEHTSIDSQGYLNGGVESGQRAAAEVVAALGK